MKLEKAQNIAATFCCLLRSGVERIAVAGSVRRGEPEVGDVEVVVVPKLRAMRRPGTLFPTIHNVAHEITEQLVSGERSSFSKGPKWGPKWRQLIYRHNADEIKIDLFLVEMTGWGPQLAIRTGPADFSRTLVARGLPHGHVMRGGTIRDSKGIVVPFDCERAFFEWCGFPWWEPSGRSEFGLSQFLRFH